MRYFIVSGEASGDLHGSNLVRELIKHDSEADIVCWGGDLMQKEGARVLMHYRDLAIMGFWEVLINLRTIRNNLKLCKQQLLDYKPDVVILIDYPGFNLRIAEFLKGKVDNVYYYISPKLWAWKESRIKKIKAYINRMYVIFPFETEFYAKHSYPVKYFGNPLVDTVERELNLAGDKDDFFSKYKLEDKPIIALLAGSRIQEVKKILPEMVKVSDYYLDHQFVVAGVKTVSKEIYNKIIGDSGVKVIYDETYPLYKYCEAALVASGTATLEAALADVPQVVCYRASWFSYLVARAFANIRFISLVNLIMGREVVKELIQDKMSSRLIVNELNSLLPGGWKRKVIKDDYAILRSELSGKGAAGRVAEDIYNSLRLVNNVN